MKGRETRRVLMTADAVGGVIHYALDLARALAAYDIEIVLAVLGPRASEESRLEAASIPSLSWLEAPYRLEWMEDPWSDVDAAGKWLQELEAALRPDVVHLNGYAHGALPFRAPKLVVGHSCVTSWWHAVKREAPPGPYRRYQARVRAGLRGADAVVAPTRHMLLQLEHHYGVLGDACVIHNGIDAQRFAAHGAKQPFVACAGRLWDEGKNLKILEQAAAKSPWPILTAGAPAHPSSKAGDADAASPSPGTRFSLLGPLSRTALAGWLGQASVYAAPARYEPFGLAVAEAAAAQCALVLADIASFRELWQGAALFVPCDDGQGWTRQLARLAADERLRRELGLRARARVRRYSLERFSRGYRRLYAQLLAGHQDVQPSNLSFLGHYPQSHGYG